MTPPQIRSRRTSWSREEGSSLLEALVAAGVLVVACTGLMAAFTIGIVETLSHGDLATRTTDLSRDKLEQLLALDFDDGATDTTVYPPAATGGTGLGGVLAPDTTVGSTDPAAPTAQYVDYVDADSAPLPDGTGAFYVRQWSISTDASGTIKTVSVITTALSAGGGRGRPHATTLTSMKALMQ